MNNIEIIKDFFPSGILAVTTKRNNGYSNLKFKSFNLSLSVNDSEYVVKKNRFLLQQKLKSNIVWMNQSHSTNVQFVNKYLHLVNADGIVSDNPNLACSVLTADCLPILACSSDAKIIGAVHVGWKGLSFGILENFYKIILKKHSSICGEFNSSLDFSIFVWIGPSICKNCFEIGSDVKSNFPQLFSNSSDFFKKKGSCKWYCDLRRIAKHKTFEFFNNYEGISIKIKTDKRCTYEERNSFFSYRRDGTTGRMASLITFDS